MAFSYKNASHGALAAETEDHDTRARLLAATERLVSEKGFEAVSLRAITREAGTNLAAVNYHFGNKRALLLEMLRQRSEPINVERLKRLRAAQARAGEKPVPLIEVVDAFLYPILRAAMREDGPDSTFIRVVGMSFSEQGGLFNELARKYFAEVRNEFGAALAAALPQYNEEEIGWRFHFAVCSALATLANHGRYERFHMGNLDPDDIPGMMRRLRDFLVGGLTAPVSEVELGGLS